MVAADELAPGIPNSTEVKVSAVVDAATTAIIKIIAEQGSENRYKNPYRATNPVVAPADGIIPTTIPQRTPRKSSIILESKYPLLHAKVLSNRLDIPV